MHAHRKDTIKGMQREPEVRVLDERKEAKRAVSSPLHENGVTLSPDFCLDERWPLA
jgi:hypothetical protein